MSLSHSVEHRAEDSCAGTGKGTSAAGSGGSPAALQGGSTKLPERVIDETLTHDKPTYTNTSSRRRHKVKSQHRVTKPKALAHGASTKHGDKQLHEAAEWSGNGA